MMFLSKSIPFLLHFWVGFLILCIGSLKFNSCVGDTTTSTSGCLERERQALIHFKQGLKDPSSRLSSWVGDDCCRWAGIHCSNETGHVIKLILRGPSEIQSSSPIATYNDIEAAFNRSLISEFEFIKNHLKGTIPENISDVRWLESLDLSWNQLSGMIPHTLSYMTSLNHLNLSHNNFSGRIPSGRQLDTINDSSIYMGNPLLCGSPLLIQCPRDERFPDSEPLSDGDKEAKDELEIQLFYSSMGPGFVVGFCVVCGVLLFKRSWRVAYYNFFDDMGDQLYVAIARKLAKFKKNKELQGNRGLPSTPKHVLHPRALPGHKSS